MAPRDNNWEGDQKTLFSLIYSNSIFGSNKDYSVAETSQFFYFGIFNKHVLEKICMIKLEFPLLEVSLQVY